MHLGKFITVEGGEGVGKSTQIAAIKAVVERAGFSVTMTREPGGTARAELIRELLLAPSTEPMPDLCELLLLFAARATHIENLIRPAIQQGDWVICDRFIDATYAYQGGGRGIPRQQIEALASLVQKNVRPDFTVLLDAPIELAMARARQRNVERGESIGDRFEQEQSEFFERVRRTYLDIARSEPNRVVVVDASRALEVVRSEVEDVVNNFIEQTRRSN